MQNYVKTETGKTPINHHNSVCFIANTLKLKSSISNRKQCYSFLYKELM